MGLALGSGPFVFVAIDGCGCERDLPVQHRRHSHDQNAWCGIAGAIRWYRCPRTQVDNQYQTRRGLRACWRACRSRSCGSCGPFCDARNARRSAFIRSRSSRHATTSSDAARGFAGTGSRATAHARSAAAGPHTLPPDCETARPQPRVRRRAREHAVFERVEGVLVPVVFLRPP